MSSRGSLWDARRFYLGPTMKHAFRSLACGGLLVALPVAGQSYQSRFMELFRNADVEGTEKLLKEWRAADANDPELYVAYFNHYIKQSRSNVISLGTHPEGDEVLELRDPDSTKKEPVGYIYDDVHYDPDLLATAFAYIDTGIAKFPQRLDMRFGKTHMYGETEDYAHFTDEVVRTIEHGAATGYAWTWTNNEPVEDPKEYTLSGTQEYVHQLWETGDDSLTKDIVRITEAVLKEVPDHVESLSTRAAIHIMNAEYGPALDLLLRAEKLAPEDAIVTSNIAETYKRQGDKGKAIKYYGRTVELGDEETKTFARKQLEELRK